MKIWRPFTPLIVPVHICTWSKPGQGFTSEPGKRYIMQFSLKSVCINIQDDTAGRKRHFIDNKSKLSHNICCLPKLKTTFNWMLMSSKGGRVQPVGPLCGTYVLIKLSIGILPKFGNFLIVVQRIHRQTWAKSHLYNNQ